MRYGALVADAVAFAVTNAFSKDLYCFKIFPRHLFESLRHVAFDALAQVKQNKTASLKAFSTLLEYRTVNLKGDLLALVNEGSRARLEVGSLPPREPKSHPVSSMEAGAIEEGRRCDDGIQILDFFGPALRRVLEERPTGAALVGAHGSNALSNFLSQAWQNGPIFSGTGWRKGSNGM